MMMALFMTSCTDDGGTSTIDLKMGAVPNFVKAPDLDEEIQQSELISGADVQIGFNFDIAQGDVASADLIAFYNKGGELIGPVVIKSGITEFPIDVLLNQDDLLGAFPEMIPDPVGGELIISAILELKDGRTLKMLNDDGSRNYGSDIHTSSVFAAQVAYKVICYVKLDDASKFDGTYTVVEDAWADYAPGTELSVNFVSDFTFRISNAANPYVNNASTTYLEVTFDPKDGSAIVTTNEAWDYGVPITPEGVGTVGTCAGGIELVLDFPGYASGQAFILSKK